MVWLGRHLTQELLNSLKPQRWGTFEKVLYNVFFVVAFANLVLIAVIFAR